MKINKSLKKFKCVDCDRKIWYGSTRCESCATKGKNNPMFGVHRFGKDNPNFKHNITKKQLYNLYWGKKLSTRKTANNLKCSQSTILRNLKKYNIKIRRNKGKNHYFYHKHHTNKIRKKLKKIKPLHHIDGNHKNKNPDNEIKLKSKSIHQRIFAVYYKFIKLQNLDKKFKKWLRKNYEVKNAK